MAKQIKLIKRPVDTDHMDPQEKLVGAVRGFLQASIAESKEPNLPPDTNVDEYIDMLAAYPRAVRRSMRGVNAAMVNLCRALKAQRDAATQTEGDAQ